MGPTNLKKEVGGLVTSMLYLSGGLDGPPLLTDVETELEKKIEDFGLAGGTGSREA